MFVIVHKICLIQVETTGPIDPQPAELEPFNGIYAAFQRFNGWGQVKTRVEDTIHRADAAARDSAEASTTAPGMISVSSSEFVTLLEVRGCFTVDLSLFTSLSLSQPISASFDLTLPFSTYRSLLCSMSLPLPSLLSACSLGIHTACQLLESHTKFIGNLQQQITDMMDVSEMYAAEQDRRGLM